MCVKQVPGTTQVEVDPVTGVLKRDGVDSKLNPYDLFALEAAFALRRIFAPNFAAYAGLKFFRTQISRRKKKLANLGETGISIVFSVQTVSVCV